MAGNRSKHHRKQRQRADLQDANQHRQQVQGQSRRTRILESLEQRHLLATVNLYSSEGVINEALPQVPAVITVERDQDFTSSLAINYYLSGDAGNGSDYVDEASASSLSGMIIIPAGESTASFNIVPINDVDDEENEYFLVTLSSSSGYSLGSSSSATITILDDDSSSATPTVTVSASSPTMTEDYTSSFSSFIFWRDQTAGSLSVDYYIGGSAQLYSDYGGPSSGYATITFPSGQSSTSVSVYSYDDSAQESDETIELSLSASSGYAIGSNSSATITILDDDSSSATPTVTVSASSPTMTEDYTSSFSSFIFWRDQTAGSLSVDYYIGGSAQLYSDYGGPSSGYATITFPSGQSSTSVSVYSYDDSAQESDETIELSLSSSSGYSLGSSSSATITILDDDSSSATPTVTVSASSPTMTEDYTSSFSSFIFWRDQTAGSLSVDYYIGGSAQLYSDYGGPSSGYATITFPSGQSSTSVSVYSYDDSAQETDETIELSLASSSGYAIGSNSSATITILDDDSSSATPTVTVSASSPTMTEDYTSSFSSFIFWRDQTAGSLSVDYYIGGSAQLYSDYGGPSSGYATITFPSGQSSTSVSVYSYDDSAQETDETIELSLASSSGYSLGSSSSATITILDDDSSSTTPTVTVSASSPTMTEDYTSSFSSFIFWRDQTAGSLSVDYYIGGSAQLYSDYGGPSSGYATITFPSGQSSTSVSVYSYDDSAQESDETIELSLSSSSGYSLGSNSSATITILDDDSSNTAPTTEGLVAIEIAEDATPQVILLADFFADAEQSSSSLVYSVVGVAGSLVNAAIDNTVDELTISTLLDAFGTTSITVRATDSGGLWVESVLEIEIAPINDAPHAVDGTYSVNAGGVLSVGVPGLREFSSDVDGDSLTLSIVNLPTHGTLAWNADGSFAYSPATSFSGSDSFVYRVTDPSGLFSEATIHLATDPYAPPVISSLLLLNNLGTIESPRTSDPQISGTLVFATPEAVAASWIEFEFTGDELRDGTTAPAGDGTFLIEIPAISLSEGEIPLRVRTARTVAGLNVVYSDWTEFAFAFEPPAEPTVAIESLLVVEDTGTSGDGITARTAIQGTVMRSGQGVPYARVDVDLDGDDQADLQIRAKVDGTFMFDIADYQAVSAGAVSMSLRAEGMSVYSPGHTAGEWQEIQFTYEPLINLPPVLSGVAVTSVPGDWGGALDHFVSLAGTLADPEAAPEQASIQFDTDNDGDVDETISLIDHENGTFQFWFDGSDLAPGMHVVQVRSAELLGTSLEVLGEWTAVTFEIVAVSVSPVVISGLQLVRDTGTSSDGITADARVGGAVSWAAGSPGGAVIEIDLNGDSLPDSVAQANLAGNFVVDLAGLGIEEGLVTASFRGSTSDQLGASRYSEWSTLVFQYDLSTLVAPTIATLSLVEDTGIANDLITANPTITGTLLDIDLANDGIYVEIDLNGDATPETSVPVINAAFQADLARGLVSPGSIVARARSVMFDLATGSQLFGEWHSLTFDYAIAEDVRPEVTQLQLVSDTEESGDSNTTDPRIEGIVQHADGSVDALPVQLDIHGDGYYDAMASTIGDGSGRFEFNPRSILGSMTGSITLYVRAGETQLDGTFAYGDWETITFEYHPTPIGDAPQVTGLHLRNNTGDPNDSQTSVPVIVGSLSQLGGEPTLITIEYDFDGDAIADAEEVVMTTGSFEIDLRQHGVTYGAKTVAVRASTPSPTSTEQVWGEWSTIDVQYEADPIIVPPVTLPSVATTGEPFAYSGTPQFASGVIPLASTSSNILSYDELQYLMVGEGLFTLFGTRFGTPTEVHTVVNNDDQSTVTNGNGAEVTTTIEYVLTTDADIALDGSWLITQTLVSSYVIVTTFTSADHAYTITQEGLHNYTFEAGGDSDDAWYSLTETKSDSFERTGFQVFAPTTFWNGTEFVTRHDDDDAASQEFTFTASGTLVELSEGNSTSESLTYSASASADYERTITERYTNLDTSVYERETPVARHTSIATEISVSLDETPTGSVRDGAYEHSNSNTYQWSTEHNTASSYESPTWSSDQYDAYDRYWTSVSDAAIEGALTDERSSPWSNWVEESAESDWQQSTVDTKRYVHYQERKEFSSSNGTDHYLDSISTNDQTVINTQLSDGHIERDAASGYESSSSYVSSKQDFGTYDLQQRATQVKNASYGGHFTLDRLTTTTDRAQDWDELLRTSTSYTDDGSSTSGYLLRRTDNVDETTQEDHRVDFGGPGNSAFTQDVTTDSVVTYTFSQETKDLAYGPGSSLIADEKSTTSAQTQDRVWSYTGASQGKGRQVVPGGIVNFDYANSATNVGQGYQESFSNTNNFGASLIAVGLMTVPGNTATRKSTYSGENTWDAKYNSSSTITDTSVSGITSVLSGEESSTDKGDGSFSSEIYESVVGGDSSKVNGYSHSESEYSGNSTWELARTTTTAGISSGGAGVSTSVDAKSSYSETGESQYSGSTTGAGTVTGGVVAALQTTESKSQSSSEFESSSTSKTGNVDRSQAGVVKRSFSGVSESDQGSTEQSYVFRSDSTLSPAGVFYVTDSTSTVVVSGERESAIETINSAEGKTKQSGIETEFKNNSTTYHTLAGPYSSSEKLVVHDENKDVTTSTWKASSDSADLNHKVTSSNWSKVEDRSSTSQTRWNDTKIDSKVTSAGTESNSSSNYTKSGPSFYEHESLETYSMTDSGDRSSDSTIKARIDKVTTSPGSSTLTSASSIIATKESATFQTSESGYDKTTLAGEYFTEDTASDSEQGEFTVSRSESGSTASASVSTTANYSQWSSEDSTNSSTSSGEGTFETKQETLQQTSPAGKVDNTYNYSSNSESGTISYATTHSDWQKIDSKNTDLNKRTISETWNDGSSTKTEGMYASTDFSEVTTEIGYTKSDTSSSYSESGKLEATSSATTTDNVTPINTTFTPTGESEVTKDVRGQSSSHRLEQAYSRKGSYSQSVSDAAFHETEGENYSLQAQSETEEITEGTNKRTQTQSQKSWVDLASKTRDEKTDSGSSETESRDGTFTSKYEFELSTFNDHQLGKNTKSSWEKATSEHEGTSATSESSNHESTVTTREFKLVSTSETGEKTYTEVLKSTEITKNSSARKGTGTYQTSSEDTNKHETGEEWTTSDQTEEATSSGTTNLSISSTTNTYDKRDKLSTPGNNGSVEHVSNSKTTMGLTQKGTYTAKDTLKHDVSTYLPGPNQAIDKEEYRYETSALEESGTNSTTSGAVSAGTWRESRDTNYRVNATSDESRHGSGTYSIKIDSWDKTEGGEKTDFNEETTINTGTVVWDSESWYHADDINFRTEGGVRWEKITNESNGTDTIFDSETNRTETGKSTKILHSKKVSQGNTSFDDKRHFHKSEAKETSAGSFVEVSYELKGDQHSWGSGRFTDSTENKDETYPDGKKYTFQESKRDEKGKTEWKDEKNRTEKRDDKKLSYINSVLELEEKQTSEGTGEYDKRDNSSTIFSRADSSSEGKTTHGGFSYDKLTSTGKDVESTSRNQVTDGEHIVESGMVGSTQSKSSRKVNETRSLVDLKTTTYTGEKADYTNTAEDGTVTPHGSAPRSTEVDSQKKHVKSTKTVERSENHHLTEDHESDYESTTTTTDDSSWSEDVVTETLYTRDTYTSGEVITKEIPTTWIGDARETNWKRDVETSSWNYHEPTDSYGANNSSSSTTKTHRSSRHRADATINVIHDLFGVLVTDPGIMQEIIESTSLFGFEKRIDENETIHTSSSSHETITGQRHTSNTYDHDTYDKDSGTEYSFYSPAYWTAISGTVNLTWPTYKRESFEKHIVEDRKTSSDGDGSYSATTNEYDRSEKQSIANYTVPFMGLLPGGGSRTDTQTTIAEDSSSNENSSGKANWSSKSTTDRTEKYAMNTAGELKLSQYEMNRSTDGSSSNIVYNSSITSGTTTSRSHERLVGGNTVQFENVDESTSFNSNATPQHSSSSFSSSGTYGISYWNDHSIFGGNYDRVMDLTIDWSQPFQGLASDLFSFLEEASWEFSTSDLLGIDPWVTPPEVPYTGIYDWIGRNVVLPYVGEERLAQGGRFGTGFVDDLMVSALLATEIVGYFDPTPISDSLNAGLNAADGNYVDAAASLAGILIPGGADKAAKGASKVGGAVSSGFTSAATAISKHTACDAPTSLGRAVGNVLGRCFVGDTQVVIDFAGSDSLATEVVVSASEEIASDVAAVIGVASIFVGVGGAVVLQQKRQKRRHDEHLEEVLGELESRKELSVDPQFLNSAEHHQEHAFDELCDQLFGGEEYSGTLDRAETCQEADDASDVLVERDLEPAVNSLARIDSRPLISDRLPQSHTESSSKATHELANAPKRKTSGQASLWVIWLSAWLMIGTAAFALAMASRTAPPPTSLASVAGAPPNHSAPLQVSAASVLPQTQVPANPRYLTQSIRDIQIGTWILADNPEEAALGFWDPAEPTDWYKLDCTIPKSDGSLLKVTLLRPDWWLDELEIAVGKRVELGLEELGADGLATIANIEAVATPPSQPSPLHRLVTAKFEHAAASILEVHLSDAAEPIRTTPTHQFWSVDRAKFIAAAELYRGERLLSASGSPSSITGLEFTPHLETVYNLEVDGEHVYYVSPSGILVHNSCSSNAAKLAENLGGRAVDTAAHHIVASGSKRASAARKILKKVGIDINDAANGVLLTKNSKVDNAIASAVHSKIHTSRYFSYVEAAVKKAYGNGKGDAKKRVASALSKIREKLLNPTTVNNFW